jgi:hypothetical protein
MVIKEDAFRRSELFPPFFCPTLAEIEAMVFTRTTPKL